MLRYQFIFALLLLYACSSFGQINYGPKLGLNFSNVHSSGYNSYSANVNFNAGVVIKMNVHDRWMVGPEILISKKGYNSILIPTGTTTNVLTYLSIPVLASYKASEKIYFLMGPEFNFLMDARMKNKNFNEVISSEFHGFDFALAAGGGFKIVKRCYIDARYLLGISPIRKKGSNFVDQKTRTIQIDLIYLLKN